MRNDAHPTGYSYEDAASVLTGLGFVRAPSAGGSHRIWRAVSATGKVTVIGLVQGSGDLKPYLIRQMMRQLSEGGFI